MGGLGPLSKGWGLGGNHPSGYQGGLTAAPTGPPGGKAGYREPRERLAGSVNSGSTLQRGADLASPLA
eukprot:5907953-Pyramimonas_sp.AAC.1